MNDWELDSDHVEGASSNNKEGYPLFNNVLVSNCTWAAESISCVQFLHRVVTTVEMDNGVTCGWFNKVLSVDVTVLMT